MIEPQTFTIGLISDTHGLLRDEALALLEGVDQIIHAGDIGEKSILERLGRIAPVSAIRGNNDDEKWAEAIAETATLSAGGILIYLVHSIADLAIDPAGLGIRAVISGHSHKPSIETRDGVMYVNPGSAGPRRFRLPISVARLRVTGDALQADILEIVIPPPDVPLRRRPRGSKAAEIQ